MSSSSLIEALPHDKAIELANDRLAAYQKKYPDRILGTATLPTVWVDDAVDELERSVKVLGFGQGVMATVTQFINAAKLTDAEREQLTEKTATERIFKKKVGSDVPAARTVGADHRAARMADRAAAAQAVDCLAALYR